MGYELGERIYDGAKTVVYRGRRLEDDAPVMVKEWRVLYPTPEELARFRREFELLRAAQGPDVIQGLALTHTEGVVRLISEDFGARSLDVLFRLQRGPVTQVLRIGLTVARALARLHEMGLIHKDITPANVVMNPNSREVKLIDFGNASLLKREEANAPMHLLGTFAGTPLYMAPEQTGRMNRSIDHRSDLYSLGATMYRLLCGSPPFEGDRLSLVHAHIARLPASPHALDDRIPVVLSEIIMTLLSKRAEERYQTAKGLQVDLERCLQLLERGELRSDTSFVLRSQDVAHELVIPEKLYGRETQVANLESTFARVEAGATECMFVSGYSGIGKTALVSEVHRLLSRGHGLLIRGKAEQFQRATPYASLIEGVEAFVEEVLAQSGTIVESWQKRLQDAVGENGAVLTEMMPSLGHLLGKQPPLAEVTPAEAENRLHEVLRRFVRAMAGTTHPLVLFLDDLQWSDLSLLRLLSELALDTETTHLLLLGAYRDNEVDETHPLTSALARIRKGEGQLHEIQLQPLQESHILALLVDTLGRPTQEVAPLARMVSRKTGGNPFFLGRFLRRLVRDGLLRLQDNRWQWQLSEIEEAGFTDNVVVFMAESLQRLPSASQQALRVAACIGGRFSLSLLAATLGQTRQEVQHALQPALTRALIQPLTQGYWVDTLGSHSDEEIPDFTFRFSHDRIVQVSIASLEPDERKELRLRLGRLLRERYALQEVSAFEVVEQLNQAKELLTSQEERQELGTMNLEAGVRALQSAAYHEAHHYLQQAVSLWEPQGWENRYQKTLELYVKAALAAQLRSDHEEMEQNVSEIRNNARTVLDRMRGEEIRIQAFVAQNKYREGVVAALAVLEELGVSLPSEPTEADVGSALEAVMTDLGARGLEELLALEPLKDPQLGAARRIIVNISSAAYLSTPHLLPLLSVELVRSSLKHGVSKQSSYGFEILGLVLCAVGMIDQGYLMGQVGVGLLERWADKGLATRVKHVFNTHVRVFKDPVAVAAGSMTEVFQTGLAHGDLEYACWAAHNHCITGYYAGMPLDELDPLADRYTQAMLHYQQLAALGCNLPFVQLIKNLRGDAKDPAILKGPDYDEVQVMEELKAISFRGAIFVLVTAQLIARYVFGKTEEAVQISQEYEVYQDGATATLHVPAFYFYTTLALLSLTPDEKRRAQAAQNLEKLRMWSSFAPANQEHRVLLLEAECKRLDGAILEAMEAYDKSIQTAQTHDLAGEIPLLQERAGRFHLAQGRSTVARAYLLEARYGWEQWGAHAKATQLAEEFPALLGAAHFETKATQMSSSSTTATGEALDLEALLRASQALSRKMRLENLLEQFMRLLLQNAGATKGYLMMPFDGVLRVQASEDAEGNVVVPVGSPADTCETLPQSIVQFVSRTGRRLVLKNAHNDPRFRKDPGLFRSQYLSVICAPIAHQGQRRAIIYLENHLTQAAFTESRTRVVELLGAQAAISIENAQLYANLEDKVAERTQKLQDTLSELQGTHARLETQHRQLKNTQAQLVQAEKMASLATLVAGMAHEFNNPINYSHIGIYNLSRHLGQLKDFLFELIQHDDQTETETETTAVFVDKFASLTKNLEAVSHGIERIGSIVDNLHAFSKLGEAGFKRTNVLDGLRATLSLVESNYQQVTFTQELQSIPEVSCWPAQLNQAFMNVAVNACQAICERYDRTKQKNGGRENFTGKLRIRTQQHDEEIEISFEDNGVGMTPETQERMLEPFFTTRDVGQGSGLGLSVVFGIVEKHKGRLEVESRPEEGTTMRIFLPLRSSDTHLS